MNEEQYERYRSLRDQGVSHEEALLRVTGGPGVEQGYEAYRAARDSGASHDEALPSSPAAPTLRERARDVVRDFKEDPYDALSRIGAGARRGLVQMAADYGPGLAGEAMRRMRGAIPAGLRPEARGYYTPGVADPAAQRAEDLRDRLQASLLEAPEKTREFLEGVVSPEDKNVFDVTGEVGGRIAGELGSAIAIGGAGAATPLLRGIAARGAAGRVSAGLLANAPIDLAQAAVYDEGLFLPGFEGALAENLLLSGAAEGVGEALRATGRARQARADEGRIVDVLRGVDEAERAGRPPLMLPARASGPPGRVPRGSGRYPTWFELPPVQGPQPKQPIITPPPRRPIDDPERLIPPRTTPRGRPFGGRDWRLFEPQPIQGPQPRGPLIPPAPGQSTLEGLLAPKLSTERIEPTAGAGRALPMAGGSRVLPTVGKRGPREGEFRQIELTPDSPEPVRNVRKSAEPQDPDAARTVAISGDGSVEVPVRFRLVEADDLVASNDPFTFRPDPEYPSGVQGRRRQYETGPTQGIVVRQAAELDPLRSLNPTISMLEGPPVVSPNAIVLAGNNRTMSIKRAIREFPSRYDAYKTTLARFIEESRVAGVTPEDLAQMQRPVLVREVIPEGDALTIGDMAAINRASDVSGTKAKRTVDVAAEKAQGLRGQEEVMGFLSDNMAPDETLISFLERPEGRRFVDLLVERNILQQNELPALLTDSGRLNSDGKNVIRRMILASALDNFEDFSPAIIKKLETASPQIAVLRGTDGDMSELINRSSLALREAADNGLSLEELASQASMFGEDALPEAVVNMAKYLRDNTQTKITQDLRDYSASVLSSQRASREGGGLFGEELAQELTESPEQAARRIGLGNLYSFPGPILDFAKTEAGKQAISSGIGAIAGAQLSEGNEISGAISGGIAGAYGLRGLRAARDLGRAARTPELREAVVKAAKVRVSNLITRAPVARGERSAKVAESTLGSRYSEYLDRYAPYIDLVKKMSGEDTARDLNESLAVFDAAAQSAVIKAYDEYGLWMTENANNLEEIAKAAAILADYANRIKVGAGELGDSGMKLTGYGNQRLQEAVDEIRSNPYLVEQTDRLQGFFRDILERRRDAGLISPEEFDRIVASTDYYTPLYKDFEELVATGGSRYGLRLVPGKGVRSMDRALNRSGRVQDPLEVLLAQRIVLEKDLAAQRTMSFLIDAVGEEGIEGIIRPITPNTRVSPNSRTFTTIVDGKPQSFEVMDRALFDALEANRAYAGPIYTAIADLKRGTIVLPPDFSVMALLRDLPAYNIQRPAAQVVKESVPGGVAGAAAGYAASDEDNKLAGTLAGAGVGLGISANARAAYEIAEGVIHAAKGTDQFQQFLREGGSTAGIAVTDPSDLSKLVKSFSEKEQRGILWAMKNPLDAMAFIGSVAENAPRFAQWKKTRSAWEAQNVTLPFARIGSSESLQKAASATPFFNATLKGWEKVYQLAFSKASRVNTLKAAGVAITAPSVGLWMLNKDNPDYWERPLWERNMFWLIPGWAVGDPGQDFYRLPKPFQLGTLYGSFPERILDSMARAGLIDSAAPAGKSAGEEIAASLLDFGKQGVSETFPIPAAIQPLFESLTNYDVFRGREITPYFIGQRAPELQYRESTSALGRAAGRIPGVTPIQFDQSVESVLGTAGRRGLDVLDIAARAAGIEAPESQRTVGQEIANIAGLGRFQAQDYNVSQTEYDAYSVIRKAEQAEYGVRQLERERASPRRMTSFQKDRAGDLRVYEITRDERAALEDLRSRRNEVLSMPGLPPEEKARVLSQLKDEGAAISQIILQKHQQVR